MALSPSAASTQVVPNGGRGSTAAGGETVPTIAVAWRIDASSVEVQAVSARRRTGRTRPAIAIVADVADAADRATIGIDVPATDKSQW